MRTVMTRKPHVTLSEMALAVRPALDAFLLGWLSEHPALLRPFTSDGFLPVRIEGRRVYLWWLFALIGHEPYTTALFTRAIGPGATVLDIGAHFGYFSSLAASKLGGDGAVYAFEPVPRNFAIVRRAIEINAYRNVQALPLAVSDRTSRARLYLTRATSEHSLYAPPGQGAGVLDVECVSIDEHLGGRPVDVVKMDVEGHELAALAGMTKTIASSRDLVLFVELHPVHLLRAGARPEDLLGRLETLGFTVRLIDERTRRLRPPEAAWEAMKRNRLWYGNLYCVKGRPQGVSDG